MKDISNTIIRTACGKLFDLKKAAPLATNTAAPYGRHNFVIYKTMNGFYLKGYNSGCDKQLVNTFEMISRNEAMHYLKGQASFPLSAAA